VGESGEVARNGWHILREGAAVTVSRRVPVVWDVAAETRLPDAGRLRVAHQVRQDLWRALRRQRGFAPAVRVARDGAGLSVRAGGRVAAPHDRARLEAEIARVLSAPAHRARWRAAAGGGAAR
jgi:hypothetical protein